MAIGFFPCLSGGGAAPAAHPDPCQQEVPPPPATVPVVEAPRPRAGEARDEIIDARSHIGALTRRSMPGLESWPESGPES